MKKILVLLIAVFAIQNAHAKPGGRFGYEKIEVNGILASLSGLYYELDAVKYPLGASQEQLEDGAEDINGHQCALFGLNADFGLDNGNVEYEIRDEEQVVLQEWFGGIFTRSNVVAKTLFCVLAEDSIPSVRYASKTINANGTVTFVEPRFLYGGTEIAFNPETSIEGPCLIFGASMITPDDNHPYSTFFTQADYSAGDPKNAISFRAYLPRTDGKLYHQTSISGESTTRKRLASMTCKI